MGIRTSKIKFVKQADSFSDILHRRTGIINPENETEILSKVGKNLYLNAEKADVHFVFESVDERVPAHKILLSSGSDVFQTMFYGPLKEEDDIKIVDATAEAFKEFLRFFYFNIVDVSMEHVSGVMYLGRKYNVAECQRLCVNLLAANITDQTVITALALAIFYEEKQLQKSCESFIAANLHKVLKSETFLVCDRRVLEHILKMDCLACSETVLFEACMSWVREISQKDRLTREIVQAQLGHLFYEIRFGTMTFDEFSNLFRMYGTNFFSTNEYNEIFQVISYQECKPKIFKTCRRLPVWDSSRLLVCNRSLNWVGGSLHRTQSEEVTMFSTNTRLLLGHFHMARLCNYEDTQIDYIPTMSATITANSTGVLTQFNFSFDNGHKINLPKPICIKPGTIYEIRIKFPMDDEQRFTQETLKSIVKMGNGIAAYFHNDEYVDGQIVGSIRCLGFNFIDF